GEHLAGGLDAVGLLIGAHTPGGIELLVTLRVGEHIPHLVDGGVDGSGHGVLLCICHVPTLGTGAGSCNDIPIRLSIPLDIPAVQRYAWWTECAASLVCSASMTLAWR